MLMAAQHPRLVLLSNEKVTPQHLPHSPFSCGLTFMPHRQRPLWEVGHRKNKLLVFANIIIQMDGHLLAPALNGYVTV